MGNIEAESFNANGAASRLLPEAIEPSVESGLLIQTALAELQRQLQSGDPMIPQLAKRGIFIWPEEDGAVLGIHSKREWGRDYETRLSANGGGVWMSWQNGSSGYETFLATDFIPTRELIRTIDDIATIEEALVFAAETERLNAERVKAWHPVNRTSHPAYISHMPPSWRT